MKLVLHSGDMVNVYSVDGMPMVIETGERLVPTVCALWKVPDLVPVLAVHTPVLSKVCVLKFCVTNSHFLRWSVFYTAKMTNYRIVHSVFKMHMINRCKEVLLCTCRVCRYRAAASASRCSSAAQSLVYAHRRMQLLAL